MDETNEEIQQRIDALEKEKERLALKERMLKLQQEVEAKRERVEPSLTKKFLKRFM